VLILGLLWTGPWGPCPRTKWAMKGPIWTQKVQIHSRRSEGDAWASTSFHFTLIVGGSHGDTCKNIKDPCSSAKCHGYSMFWPIKDHATKTQQNQVLLVCNSLFEIYSTCIITDAGLMINCGLVNNFCATLGPVPLPFSIPHLNFAEIPHKMHPRINTVITL